MITISNDHLSAKISEKGAELQSLQYKNIEYMWQANPAWWAKHSPILFPVIGELKDGKYIFEGREYSMPRHGFARDKIFQASQTSATSVTFMLNDDESSFAVYPFRFVFTLQYRLEATTLFCIYHVKNSDSKMMYFSVGGHPAFNVPLQSDLHYSDYTLTFNDDTVLKKYLLHNGLTGDDTETIVLDNNKLQLHPSLFYADAIVLKHLRSNQIELATEKDEHGLRFSFNNFSYFGIWAARDASFICLEPWCGIADNLHHDHQLIHKEGINKLAAGESWQRTWNVKVF